MPSIIPKITINGKESTEISGLIIVSLPPIIKPAMRAVAEEIDGRDGDQIEKLGFSAYDKTIRIALSGNYDVDDVIEYFNQDGIITFSNEPDKYYRFKQLEGIDFEKLMRYKTADVVFHCQPFKFSTTDDELTFFEPQSVSITNAGNIYSKPEIALTGHGNMEMGINGSPVLAVDFGDEQQTIIIDSEKMNAYGAQSNIKSLITEINPKQDLHGYDSAWMDVNAGDNIPYIKRNVAGTASRIGNALIDKLIGGSYAFNQLATDFVAQTVDGLTIINNNDGSITVNGLVSSNGDTNITGYMLFLSRHKYLIKGYKKVGNNDGSFSFSGVGIDTGNGNIWNNDLGDINLLLRFAYSNGDTFNNVVMYPQIYDLTQMLGSTIADYIYYLEQATAGAGVSYFRALFPDDYYPYNAGELLSVKASAHIMRNASNAIIGNYALDANLELRGIPQIDANGKLTYDGDEYSSDGSVVRKYGIVDLGSLGWGYIGENGVFIATITDIVNTDVERERLSVRCSAEYITPSFIPVSWADVPDKSCLIVYNNSQIAIKDIAYNNTSDFAIHLQNINARLVYLLETATTETAQPFTNPQNVDANGSEEYTDARAVKIPVGHETAHANICEIEGWNACDVVRTGKNLLPPCLISGDSSLTITSDNGKYTISGTATGYNQYIASNTFFLPKGNYTLKNLGNTDGELHFQLRSIDGKTTYADSILNPSAFTLTENTELKARITVNHSGSYTYGEIITPQIEMGSEATDFEEYEGITKTIPFNQTIFGGRLNIKTGRMEINQKRIVLDGSQPIGLANWNPNTNSRAWIYLLTTFPDLKDYEITDLNISSCKLKADRLKPVSYRGANGIYSNDISSISIVGGDYWSIAVRVDDASLETETAINNYLAQNPIQVCFELAEPIILQLTAQEIMALIGENHIFTNTGAIESCVYMKDGAEIEASGEIITFIADVGDIISNAFKNRLVIGNYDDVKLEKGINTITFNPIEEGSEIDEMAISKYSRWL